jgi:hypothetical protein
MFTLWFATGSLLIELGLLLSLVFSREQGTPGGVRLQSKLAGGWAVLLLIVLGFVLLASLIFARG